MTVSVKPVTGGSPSPNPSKVHAAAAQPLSHGLRHHDRGGAAPPSLTSFKVQKCTEMLFAVVLPSWNASAQFNTLTSSSSFEPVSV